MDNILDKARAGQNVLERLMNWIPGFKGYRDKELRRDADKLQREYLAGRLDEAKKGLNDLANAATRGGSLDALNDIETARKRLDKVANRVRYADRGYAGFFAAVKVDEAALARVYDFDLALLSHVDRIRAAGSSGEATAIKDMIGEIDQLDSRLDDREQILSGIS